MKWHGFLAIMYDFRSCRRGMAVLQKLSMLNDGTLKMPIVVDDPTHDSNAFLPICWIHHEGSTNKIRMPNKIRNLVLVSDIILQLFFFRANLSDGIQSLVLYSIECADTSFRDLESFLLVERFIASEIFRGKKCWEMWVPNHFFLVALQRLLGMIGGKSMVFWAKKKIVQKTENQISRLTWKGIIWYTI